MAIAAGRLDVVMQRNIRKFNISKENGSGRSDSYRDIFGCNRFGISELKKTLPPTTFETFMQNLKTGSHVSRETSDAIAEAVKNWAVAKGVTHYCHWFQPQTGSTAEKHDAMLKIDEQGLAIDEFTGDQLVQGEPDASSFPSGGMRTTFEARGYTAWDPTSPMFIIETENGKTLTIPCVFISYTGEALDKKTPLLRSMRAIDVAAKELLAILPEGLKVESVTPVAGPEQEYFLIDKAFFFRRPDLVLTGRVMGGTPSTKGQYLEDHYFGAIPTRVQAFMQETEYELYKIGVVAKTRHNEVAPSQFEIAVLHQDANVAADHNQMVMVTMERVAERHDFKLLLHEKPFDGINGSGKHVNWSMVTNTGINLLSPGSTSSEYLRFMCFLAAILKGIHLYGGLIRASIGSLANDRRLGGNEAPPAIISVFLGETINKLLEQIKAKNFNVQTKTKEMIALGLKSIPNIEKDDTDRNRTSPFAFTGNKFEYRAVGSSASISMPIMVINTVIAEGLKIVADELKKQSGKESDKQVSVMKVLSKIFKETEVVLFDGNNYSNEWAKEAKQRGLPNYHNSLEAMSEFLRNDVMEMFQRHGVLSHREVVSRYNVRCERYLKKFEIECKTLEQMVVQEIIPALECQITGHCEAISAIKSATKTVPQELMKLVQQLTTEMKQIINDTQKLTKDLHIHFGKGDMKDHMKWVIHSGFPAQRKIEKALERAESLVAYKNWPLPKVYEMLHIR
jgi:glutamine synthetase